MAYDKFLVAPLTSGTQQNVKPWLIMDDAFDFMRNMYTWRGRVKKRVGARVMNGGVSTVQQQFYTRLRIKLGTTDGLGYLAGNVPGTIYAIGQAFSIGDVMLTVVFAGTPGIMESTTGSLANTYNTTTGAYVIVGAPINTDVYFYPAQPVMALVSYDSPAINNEQMFGFDTQFAYTFVDALGWQRVGAGAVATWTGTDADFFWTTNYRGAAANDYLMFITNNVPADAMRYWDGAAFNAFGSAATTPINAANDFVKTCLLMISFKNRLLLLNTTEHINGVDQTFTNRVRWCQTGSPLITAGSPTPWYDTGGGQFGGFVDAPTREAITAIDILKDRLIVFFENSTYELVYNGNQTDPFQFQKLDSDLGVESTHSVISFNKFTFGFGSVGIHSCNGLNVDRIDQLIPYTIFDVNNENFGPQRVAGIRDFWVELLYWAYPSVRNSSGPQAQNKYPNAVLVYDYVNGTWAINDDSITAFGNFFLQESITWQGLNSTWEETDDLWDDPSLQDNFRSIVAGNQQGFTFVVDEERSVNSIALQITDMDPNGQTVNVFSYEHNLKDGSYVYITGVVDSDGILATAVNGKIFKITYIDKDTFSIIIDVDSTSTYYGGGSITRVSEPELFTKQYNFYNKVGADMALLKTQLLVDRTSSGQLTVDWAMSTNNESGFLNGELSGSAIGTAILETTPYALVPFEQNQKRFWHTVYQQAQGENVQLFVYLNDEQLLDTAIAFSDIEINAFMYYVTPVQTYGQ